MREDLQVSTNPARTPESPFLGSYEVSEAAVGAATALPLGESPFLNEYVGDADGETDVASDLVAEFLEELHDDEFGAAIQQLVDHANTVLAPGMLLEGETDDAAESQLREYFAPLVALAEAYVDRVASELPGQEAGYLSDAQLDEAIDRVAFEHSTVPQFEFFLGGLKKKLKKIGKKAISLAKKGLALTPMALLLRTLIPRLKPLIKPLLDKVVKLALDKIPEPYRPLAKRLAAGLSGKAAAVLTKAASSAASTPSAAAGIDPEPTPNDAPPEPGAAPVAAEPAAPDVAQVQDELDVQMAELMLAGDPRDEEIGESHHQLPVRATDPYGDLERARARFVRELGEAEGPEELAPAVEHFVPAVMLALRTGIKLVGRPRVVSLLGGLIAKFIGPLVGKQNAPALGKVIADVGLRTVLQAEVRPADERTVLGEALAGTVEEAVRRVAALPESVFEDGAALENYAFEAFQGAVAANFPPSLVRPELRESEHGAAWVWLPRRGRRLYKKLGRVHDVAITPAIANAVTSFDGTSLGGFFRDCLRLAAGGTVHARVHVYEAVPRTTLSRIAANEEVRGLGSSERAAVDQLHPLTPDAAMRLLGSDRLGRELAEHADPEVAQIGGRYYYLEIAEAPARPLGKASHMHLTIDLRKEEIRLCMYLGEVVAQRIATALRKNTPPAAVVAELRSALAGPAAAIGGARAGRLVRIRGIEAAPGGATVANVALRATRRALKRQIAALAMQWTWAHLGRELGKYGAQFIATTDGPEDGVRLSFRFGLSGGLAGIRQVFRGRPANGLAWPPKESPRGELKIQPGPRHD